MLISSTEVLIHGVQNTNFLYLMSELRKMSNQNKRDITILRVLFEKFNILKIRDLECNDYDKIKKLFVYAPIYSAECNYDTLALVGKRGN